MKNSEIPEVPNEYPNEPNPIEPEPVSPLEPEPVNPLEPEPDESPEKP
jgi:hypothetical protein